MKEDSTSMLMNILQSASESDLNNYEKNYLAAGPRSFPAYMDELIQNRKLKRQDIFQKADLPWKYGYKLLSGETHTRDRDKLLRIFFAMGLTLKEVQRALALYGMPGLYPKLRRDTVFIIAFNRGVDSVDTVNEWLTAHGEPELSRSAD